MLTQTFRWRPDTSTYVLSQYASESTSFDDDDGLIDVINTNSKVREFNAKCISLKKVSLKKYGQSSGCWLLRSTKRRKVRNVEVD